MTNLTPNIGRFLSADDFQVDLFLIAIKDFVQRPQSEFHELLKNKKSKHLKKDLDEFRVKLANAARSIIGLKESDKLSKRTTSDELIRDLWHIAYAYTNKKVTNQIKSVFAGFKGFQSTICEIPELYPDDPAAAFMKLV